MSDSNNAASTGWSGELVSVVTDYRVEWRQPEGRQDAREFLLRSTGGGGGMGHGEHGPYSATPVSAPRLSQSTLTDAEREAVEWAAAEADEYDEDEWQAHERAATLRGLLERTK